VSPFFEDNFNDLRDLIGADRILFGSDWPHVEGLDQPADYLKEISTTSTMLRRPRFWVAMRAT
jgi:predicted TIM-barrel fold metal-dependent hydrolase